MPRGNSGRIVLEVDPSKKNELYEALGKDGLTLKDWFLSQARHYLQNRNQTELLFFAAEESAPYSTARNSKTERPGR